jgi:signal recognition particle receptor subunit beta
MGSSPSVEHGANSGGASSGSGRGVEYPRQPQEQQEQQEVDSQVSSLITGGKVLQHATTATRTRTRQALLKKHVKGRVVFLGLDGAGKTTLIKQLQQLAAVDDPFAGSSGDGRSGLEATTPETARTTSPLRMLQSSHSRGDLTTVDGTRIPRLFPDPTKTTSSVVYRLDGDRHVQLVDVPGRRLYRVAHWRAALVGDPSSSSAAGGGLANGAVASTTLPIVGVVFVVDATDTTRFPIVARELVGFHKLKDGRTTNGAATPLATWLQRAPFLLVLNKVDAAACGSSNPQAVNSVERRRTSRLMRQQLKTAFDHELRMDQKKHPKDYASVISAVASAAGEPTMVAGATANGIPPAPSLSKKHAAMAEANSNRKTLLMTSLIECCAFDHDCVRAIQTLLRDDIRQLWLGGP